MSPGLDEGLPVAGAARYHATVQSHIRFMNARQEEAEDELVAACRRGERWARRELFEAHNAAVFRALLALSADPAIAEDLLQETFLRAFRSMGGFRGHSSVRTWLLRIGTNAFYENRRRDRTRRRYVTQIDEEPGAPSLRVVRDESAGTRDSHELRDLALRGLAALRSNDRTIITLHDIEGYRYTEIAEILDIAPGTVGSRLSRARERMASAIRELLGLRAEEDLTLEHLYGRRATDSPKDRRRRGSAPASRRNEE